MMSDETPKLIGTFLGGSVVTVVVSYFLSGRKEKRELRRQKRDELSKLYEDTLCVLERGKRDLGRGDDAFRNEIVAVNARLELNAPPEVLKQFVKAGTALQAWAAVARSGEPRPIGSGQAVIQSGMEKYRDEADRLAPSMQGEMEKLKALMRDHLAAIDV